MAEHHHQVPPKWGTTTVTPEQFRFLQQKRLSNIAIGLSLAVGVGAVYYYAIKSVGKDDFSDVDEQGNIQKKPA